ncbi:MAG: class I SAM-dependent methyltransferase [Aureisphaera sp.]
MVCPLCKSTNVKQRVDAFQFLTCSNCGSVFRNPEDFPNPQKERERYLQHNNNIEDPRYQRFVNPIVEAVVKTFPTTSMGLDFGAGTGPVISKILGDRGYAMHLWDPFFHSDRSVLDKTYDFIVCCEVIEHFHKPYEEFQLMQSLLKPNGTLFCMSELLPGASQFSTWYYKDDPTHVIFYSEQNLLWIQEHLEYAQLEISDRLIVLSKA